MSLSRASAESLSVFYPSIKDSIRGAHASLDTCEQMRSLNSDSQWSVRSHIDGCQIGYYFMLMLSQSGLSALLDDTFDFLNPRRTHVSSDSEPVAAIYKWGVFVPGIAAAAIPAISQFLRSPRYVKADIFANASTEKGRAMMIRLGFVPRPQTVNPSLYWYQRLVNRVTFSPSINLSKPQEI